MVKTCFKNSIRPFREMNGDSRGNNKSETCFQTPRRRAMSGMMTETSFDVVIVTEAERWVRGASWHYSTSVCLENSTLGFLPALWRDGTSAFRYIRSPAWVAVLCPMFLPWGSSCNAPRDLSKSQTALLHRRHILVPFETKKNVLITFMLSMLFPQQRLTRPQ